jgi:hypothetical protein
MRWDGPDLVIVIPPPSMGRLMAARGIGVAAFGIISMLCLIAFLGILNARRGLDRAVVGILALITLGVGRAFVKAVWSSILTARHGRISSVLRISSISLEITTPTLKKKTPVRWDRNMIVDVGVRAGGVMPILLPYIRIQVSLIDDTADVILLPCRGNEPLATIEDNIRDVIGLPAPSPSGRGLG